MAFPGLPNFVDINHRSSFSSTRHVIKNSPASFSYLVRTDVSRDASFNTETVTASAARDASFSTETVPVSRSHSASFAAGIGVTIYKLSSFSSSRTVLSTKKASFEAFIPVEVERLASFSSESINLNINRQSSFESSVIGRVSHDASFAYGVHIDSKKDSSFSSSRTLIKNSQASFFAPLRVETEKFSSFQSGIPRIPPTLGRTVYVTDCSSKMSGRINTSNITSLSISDGINRGWEWSATIPEEIDDILFGVGPDDTIAITVVSDNQVLTSPPLVITSRQRGISVSQGPVTTISGIDLYSKLLGSDGMSFDTFVNMTSDEIIRTLCESVGVKCFNPPSFDIPIEDVKFQKPLDGILRICREYGYSYSITSEGITFFPAVMSGQLLLEFEYSDISEQFSPCDRRTGLFLQKEGRSSGEQCFDFDSPGAHMIRLQEPLHVSSVRDESSNAIIQSVSLFDGSDFIRTIFFMLMGAPIFTVPRTSLGPTDNAVVVVIPTAMTISTGLPVSGRICLLGRTQRQIDFPNVDDSFLFFFGNMENPAPAPRTSELWARESDAREVAPNILFQMNKSSHTLDLSGPLHGDALNARVGNQISIPGRPRSRIETISWDLSPGQASYAISAVAVD